MSGSWNAHDLREAMEAACKGDFRPRRYVLTVDDTHNQSRYHGAAQALGMRETESFSLFAAEYVLARHRVLAELRATGHGSTPGEDDGRGEDEGCGEGEGGEEGGAQAMARMTTASFTVRATIEQSARWKRAAEAEGHRSAGTWLAAAADAYLKVRARAGLPLPLVWSRGKVRVDLEDGHTVELPGWRDRPFGFYRGDGAGPGQRGRHAFTLVYLPDRRPVATLRYARHYKALASELASVYARDEATTAGVVERHRREAM